MLSILPRPISQLPFVLQILFSLIDYFNVVLCELIVFFRRYSKMGVLQSKLYLTILDSSLKLLFQSFILFDLNSHIV
jgi:hypothetical protein